MRAHLARFGKFWAELTAGAPLPAADEAFVLSARLWEEGVAGGATCPLDGSRLLDLEASLRKSQRRPLEALALLGRAAQTPHRSAATRARLLIKTANTLEIMEAHAQAIATLREAEPDVEASEDTRLFWLLRCGLILNLCALDRAAEADASLLDARRRTIGRTLAAYRVSNSNSRKAGPS